MAQETIHKNNLNPLPTEQTDSTGKSPKVWIIITILLVLLLVAISIYSYMTIKNLNKKVTDQQAQITELQNKKKTLEDAAGAAATATTNAVASAQLYSIPELGIKIKLDDNLKGLLYSYDQANGVAGFTTRDLAYKVNTTAGPYKTDNPYSVYTGTLGLVSVLNTPNQPGCEASCPQNISQLSNNKYILYSHPQSLATDNTVINQQVENTINSLKAALKNAQPI